MPISCVHMILDPFQQTMPPFHMIPHMHLMGRYEDEGEEEWQRHVKHAQFLEIYTPGKYISLVTGGLLEPPCGHHDCKTYMPDYDLYIVPSATWEIWKRDVSIWYQQWCDTQMICKKEQLARAI